MSQHVNRVLKGRKASYQILEALKGQSVFKAQVVRSGVDDLSSKPVVIKDIRFERESRTHQVPQIAASPFIRQLEDVIDPDHSDRESGTGTSARKLVFEWMDTDLWRIQPFGKLENPRLPQIVAKSVLEALALFHELQSIHTGSWSRRPFMGYFDSLSDVNPNNIFLSNIDSATPTVKLGDLDNAFLEGCAVGYNRAQTHETRAPEVWKGLGVWHASDIWSLGVTMAHWLASTTIFGPRDKLIEEHLDAWCLAKIFRMVGPIEIPEDPRYKDEFELAQGLEQSTYPHPETEAATPFITRGTIRQELEKIPREVCSEECISFIEHLLVISPERRPTAEQALQHPFLQQVS